jgi:eukaryotic-like serine/threonine-protein kinase
MGLPSGTRLGPYEVLTAIGAGGMGEVYRARDTRLDRIVALKVISSHHSSDPVRRQRFEREARAISALQHPNICTLYDVGHQDGTDYLVMEYLEGESLSARLTAGALSLEQTLRYGIEIADALDAAHRRGIVHRDLKPGNIIVTAHGECKVLDFGLAKLADEPASSDAATVTRPEMLTSPGVALGTVAYMSPEQVRGDDLDARTDIFSLGTVLYEMATGKLPFVGKTSAMVFKAILDETPSSPTNRNPALPEPLDQVVGRALEKDRELRYQTAADLRADLKRLKRETESGRNPVSRTSQTTAAATTIARHRRARLSIALLLAFILLCAAGFGVYALLTRSGPEPFHDFTVTQITNTGKAEFTAISPDGKYLLNEQTDRGKHGLWLRNILTGSDTQITEPNPDLFVSLSFSPDGNYVYYRQRSSNATWNSYRLPVLGGARQLIALDVDSNVTFSPDGRLISYVRGNDPEVGKFRFLSANPDGSNETVLFLGTMNRIGNNDFPRFGAWSRDGKWILYSSFGYTDQPGALTRFDLTGAHYGLWADLPQNIFCDLQWLPQRDRLLVEYSEKGPNFQRGQIGIISGVGSTVRPVTRDANSYASLTVSDDGKSAATVQVKTTMTLQVFPAQALSAGDTPVTEVENVHAFAWSADGNLLISDGSNLERIDTAGRKRATLAADPAAALLSLSECANGTVLVNWRFRGGTNDSTIWRLNPDGSDPKQLDNRTFDAAPACSADSQWAYYTDSLLTPMRVPLAGGQPASIPGGVVANAFEQLGRVGFSPDGKKLAIFSITNDPVTHKSPAYIAIMDVNGSPQSGPQLVNPDPRIAVELNTGGVRFTRDGKALIYAVSEKDVHNLWLQPLDGSPGRQLTNFTSGGIFDFDWSADGKWLAVLRKQTSSDVVVLRENP